MLRSPFFQFLMLQWPVFLLPSTGLLQNLATEVRSLHHRTSLRTCGRPLGREKQLGFNGNGMKWMVYTGEIPIEKWMPISGTPQVGWSPIIWCPKIISQDELKAEAWFSGPGRSPSGSWGETNVELGTSGISRGWNQGSWFLLVAALMVMSQPNDTIIAGLRAIHSVFEQLQSSSLLLAIACAQKIFMALS